MSSYHSQDGIEEDVQLNYGEAGVVQNGPGQFKHTVICGQVQVVQDVLVTAHFLRGRPSYCTLKLSERFFFFIDICVIEALFMCTFALCYVLQVYF